MNKFLASGKIWYSVLGIFTSSALLRMIPTLVSGPEDFESHKQGGKVSLSVTPEFWPCLQVFLTSNHTLCWIVSEEEGILQECPNNCIDRHSRHLHCLRNHCSSALQHPQSCGHQAVSKWLISWLPLNLSFKYEADYWICWLQRRNFLSL